MKHSPTIASFLVLIVFACSKADNAGKRAGSSDGTESGSGGEVAAGDASVAVIVDDGDFATAVAPTSVSGTNLSLVPPLDESREVVASSIAANAAGELVRTEVARLDFAGDRFDWPGLPGDQLLELAIGAKTICLPALRSTHVGVVLDRAATHGCKLLVLFATAPGAAALINEKTVDVAALAELGALVAATEKAAGVAMDPAALQRLATAAAQSNTQAVAGKDPDAVAATLSSSYAATRVPADVAASFDAHTYEPALAAKKSTDGSGLDIASLTLAAVAADGAALGALTAVTKEFVYVRALASADESSRDSIRASVDALSADDLKKQVDGSLTPQAATDKIVEAAQVIESNAGATTGGGDTKTGTSSGASTTGSTTGSSGGAATTGSTTTGGSTSGTTTTEGTTPGTTSTGGTTSGTTSTGGTTSGTTSTGGTTSGTTSTGGTTSGTTSTGGTTSGTTSTGGATSGTTTGGTTTG